MNPQGQKIQILADLVLPLIGYYFWGWNVYFILFFFALDLVAQLYFTYLKSRKIVRFQQVNYPVFLLGSAFLGYLTASILLVLFMPYIVKGSDFYKEFSSFLSYKEMGVPQLILLLPLIFVGGYMNYKVTFLQPKKYTTDNILFLWKDQLINSCALLIGVLLFMGISFIVDLPATICIWSMLLLITLYKLYVPESGSTT